MVSTRSHSVLSADGANGDAAATAGEVNSAAPTPRRSGRLRGAPTPTAATAAAQAPPASARAARSRRPLKAIDEEQEQADEQQAAQQQEEQQQQEKEGAGERAAPTARRRSGAAAAAGAAAAPAQQEQQQQAAAEAEPDQQPAGEEAAGDATATAQAGPLKAAAAVVDLLAEQMFAALDGAFGAGGSSSSESDSEPEPEPAAGRQQQEQQPAAAAGQGSSDEGSESEGDEQEGHHVPAHLRWRPELTLPGMGPQQQRQRGGSAQAGAAAAAAAAAPGVHVVRRGGKDSLHVPPPDEQVRARAARKTAPDTAGKGWFDLPATKITDEVKLDLRMLRLRWVGTTGQGVLLQRGAAPGMTAAAQLMQSGRVLSCCSAVPGIQLCCKPSDGLRLLAPPGGACARCDVQALHIWHSRPM